MVRVRLFGRLREQAGRGALDLDLPAGATTADAYDALHRLHPVLPSAAEGLRVAVNTEFVDYGAALADGDELAFLQPVSGGSVSLLEIVETPLDPRRLEAAVAHPGAGGICTFTGVVRDNSRGRS